ncbi:porin [Methylobacterium planeticum]|uniref:Porin n=1 Tax=Methylobacterium planeticum TaxID=2615211 RepID=A0A6N6MN22_9HYPH|nr:porin [Methylobacterium planeticum]KAB1071533.1 porin [Methylobacterium planeticum]
MKLVKSLLLGSAAGLTAVAGAQAADLPVKKAIPVEYVRVCSAYGAGFFYIPGTDTCLRVSGRARFEAGYVPGYNRNANTGDTTQYRGLARFNLDARTQTAYGTLRAFTRLEVASRTGQHMTSGTQQRFANAFPALGPDTFGRAQQYVNVDKAFVQFAGLTAGRASSFFDFYAHDFEMIALTGGSDVPSTNLLAYTAKFGDGFSATISMEDPTFRFQPIYSSASNSVIGNTSGFNVFTASSSFAPVAIFNAAGQVTGLQFLDATQKNRTPDFVGVLRYDAAWGSAQLSAAVHEINMGSATGSPLAFTTLPGGAATPVAVTGTAVAVPRVSNAYGFGVQGGVKLNLPFIAPGDTLYLQGAYADGAMSYSGFFQTQGGEISSTSIIPGASVIPFLNDAVVNPLTRRIETSQSWTVTASYLHYWSPEWRSAFFGSYGEVYFPQGARRALASVNFGLPYLANGIGASAAQVAAFNFTNVLRDANVSYAGASLIWSPVKDLDIGFEGAYLRYGLNSGRQSDTNQPGFPATVNGVPTRTVSSTDGFYGRFRVQRDF